jgi:hypothetical protein
MAVQMINEVLFAAIESVARSIGPDTTARMRAAIQKASNDALEKQLKEALWGQIYPVTQMTEGDLCSAYFSGANVVSPAEERQAFKRIANTALRHACDAGQIITREEFDRAMGDRKARDWAVAEAVRDAANKWIADRWNKLESSFDLAAIIAGVKA